MNEDELCYIYNFFPFNIVCIFPKHSYSLLAMPTTELCSVFGLGGTLFAIHLNRTTSFLFWWRLFFNKHVLWLWWRTTIPCIFDFIQRTQYRFFPIDFVCIVRVLKFVHRVNHANIVLGEIGNIYMFAIVRSLYVSLHAVEDSLIRPINLWSTRTMCAYYNLFQDRVARVRRNGPCLIHVGCAIKSKLFC